MKTFYDTLKIPRNATQEQIQSAFKKRCLETHPDKGGRDIDFINVKKAFDVLYDPERRKAYDQYIALKEYQEFKKKQEEEQKAKNSQESQRSARTDQQKSGKGFSTRKDEPKANPSNSGKKQKRHISFIIYFILVCVISFFVMLVTQFIHDRHNMANTETEHPDVLTLNNDQKEKVEDSKLNIIEVQKLYNALINAGYTQNDIGDEKTFFHKMKNKARRGELYGLVLSRGDYQIGDYDKYELRMTSATEDKTHSYIPNNDIIFKHKGQRYRVNEADLDDFAEEFPDAYTVAADKDGEFFRVAPQDYRHFQAMKQQNDFSTQDNKRLLYQALNIDYDMGDFETFSKDVEDPVKRRRLYDEISDEYELGDYETFSRQLVGENGMHSMRESTPDFPKEETYTETVYSTGDIPYASVYGKGRFDNNSLSELVITNYSSSEAVVLLVNMLDVVVRNVYIKNGSNYTMKRIPEGYYIVKVMYGNSWNGQKDNGAGNPKGGFMKNVSYSETSYKDRFDFRFDYSGDNISYPTYSMTLHKVTNGNLNTKNISKGDFFN